MRNRAESNNIQLRKEAIEIRLQANLEAAREAYEKAKEEYRKALELEADLERRNPDGRRAFLRAAVEQRRAIHQYAVALQAFDDFVFRGVLPANLRESA